MEGGCHCGAIRFKTTTQPYWTGACYCIDCRKISGAPYVVFAGFKKGEIEILQGVPKEYSSSKEVIRSFCDTCSSPVTYTYKERPDEPFVSVGTFDDARSVAPKEHIWVSHKLPWVPISDDFPQREE